MVVVPVLKNGPFGLNLEKSVRYIVLVFKGVSCGVVFATVLAMIILAVGLAADTTTAAEASTMNRQFILSMCVCAFAMAYFFLCSYLNKGVEERNRTWIFPWFLVTAVVAFALIILFIVTLTDGFGLIHLVLPIIIVFMFYCVLVVYSFYTDLGVNFVADTPPTQVVPS